MKTDDHPEYPEHFKQLEKYAQDLALIYKKEKEKRAALVLANRQLEQYAGDLNTSINQLKQANAQLLDAYLDTIHRLSIAAEFKDEDTGAHILRISKYSALIAQKLCLPAKEVEIISSASPMHDVGKVSIPDAILMKPGKLSRDEFETIKTHTTFGARILSNSKAEVIQAAERIALSHHEKWNGKGYPLGLAGTDIPLAARIVGLVDVFDALTTIRPYKGPYPLEFTLEIIRKERGEHFDPDVVDVFLDHIDEILQIKKELGIAETPKMEEFTLSERDACPPE